MEKTLKEYDYKYSVSTDGIIYSLKGNKKPLIGKLTNWGYRMILITHNNKRKYILLHRLIATTFIPNPENKSTINHIDGNKDNNCIDNLEWATQSENQIHARDFGLTSKCKIDINIANEIRLFYINNKISTRKLGELYGLCSSSICDIINNKKWVL